MSEVLNVLKERSSIRKYEDTPLTEEELHTLLTAGLQAPTARNEQELHFTAVSGGHVILKEIDTEKQSLNGAADSNFYYDAPTVILISADQSFGWSQVDAGIAVQSIALAAESIGLGSLIIGSIKGALTGEKKASFAKELAFPENYEFVIAIAVGHKATQKEPHTIDFEKSVSIL